MRVILNKRHRISTYQIANVNITKQLALNNEHSRAVFHIFADLTDDTGVVKQHAALHLTLSELEGLITRFDGFEYDEYFRQLTNQQQGNKK